MTRRLLFDVSGLVQWYAFLRYPSGIQRVAENILSSLIRRYDRRVECIARPPGSMHFYSVPSSIISGLVHQDGRELAISQLRRLFGDMVGVTPPTRLLPAMRYFHIPYVVLGYSRTTAIWQAWATRQPPDFALSAKEIVPPSAGDVLIGLGDFWCYREHVQALLDMKKKSRLRLVHMVHDLFSLERPEWSHPYYGPQFVSQLEKLAPHVDHWMVNSRFVANKLQSYLANGVGSIADIDVIPMGWDTAFPAASASIDSDSKILARFELPHLRYVLHVGSVEPRKNLQTLVNAFRRLHRDYKGAAPLCILVGQNGWKVQEIRRQVKQANLDGEVIRWIGDANDRELAALYRKALFTVVPSHTEGWGLAVQESLAHGTPCIASRAGGLPEAGIDLARYVDPDDPEELYRAIVDWAFAPEVNMSVRSRVRQRMRMAPPLATWDLAADRVLEACEPQPLQDSCPRRVKA